MMQSQCKGTCLFKMTLPFNKILQIKVQVMHFVIGYLIIATVWGLFLYYYYYCCCCCCYKI